MLTKAFAWLFLFLTVLNIPVYAFFYSGNITELESTAISLSDYFSMLSLGNIGSSINACGENNLAIENEMILSCSYGHLGSLEAWGLSKDDSMICNDMAESDMPLTFLDFDCRLAKNKLWTSPEDGDRL